MLYIVFDSRAAGGNPDDASVLEAFDSPDDASALREARESWSGYRAVLYRTVSERVPAEMVCMVDR